MWQCSSSLASWEHCHAATGSINITSEKHQLPSGKQTKNYWSHGHRNSWFTHEKWWFSIVFCMFTRG
jgi:hypothetical protein